MLRIDSELTDIVEEGAPQEKNDSSSSNDDEEPITTTTCQTTSRKSSTVYALLILVLITGATLVLTLAVSRNGKNTSDSDENAPRSEQDSSSHRAWWTSRGYGLVLTTTMNHEREYQLLEQTAISCILVESGTRNELMDRIQVVVDGVLALSNITDRGSNTTILFDKVNDPSTLSGCRDGQVTPVVGDVDYIQDALVDFDVMVATFQEHSIVLRNDEDVERRWRTAVDLARSNLYSNSSEMELLDTVITLLTPLQDENIRIQFDDAVVELRNDEFQDRLLQEFGQQTTANDFETYKQAQLDKWMDIVASYMDNGLQYSSSGVRWGKSSKTGTSVGHVQLSELHSSEGTFQADLDSALEALVNTSAAVVLDIRLNKSGGEHADAALHMASYFVSEPTIAFIKRVVNNDGFTNWMEVMIEPRQSGNMPVFQGKIVVIVSGSTVGAAEIFTLAMSHISPQTILLGRNTAGALSNRLHRQLPNGWRLSLSNQEYASPDGSTIYDATIGIRPDIYPPFHLLPLTERQEGIDSWLQLALLLASSSS